MLTLANETLGPERLTGEEAGVSVAATRSCDGARDVLQQPREQSDRQRHRGDQQRAGHTGLRGRADLPAAAEPRQHEHRGFQTDVSYRVNGHWGVSGAYVFDIAKVHESKVDAAGNDLTGKYLAEVPKHRVSFQAELHQSALR